MTEHKKEVKNLIHDISNGKAASHKAWTRWPEIMTPDEKLKMYKKLIGRDIKHIMAIAGTIPNICNNQEEANTHHVNERDCIKILKYAITELQEEIRFIENGN